MTTTTHKRSIHIDAPVQRVFSHVEDPRHFYEAFEVKSEKYPPKIIDVDMRPEGVGSTYQWIGHLWSRFYMRGTTTREEYVANERIVDHSSAGPVFTLTLEPDAAGTTLSLAVALSTKVPLLDKLEDAIVYRGDQELDAMLHRFKTAIET